MARTIGRRRFRGGRGTVLAGRYRPGSLRSLYGAAASGARSLSSRLYPGISRPGARAAVNYALGKIRQSTKKSQMHNEGGVSHHYDHKVLKIRSKRNPKAYKKKRRLLKLDRNLKRLAIPSVTSIHPLETGTVSVLAGNNQAFGVITLGSQLDIAKLLTDQDAYALDAVQPFAEGAQSVLHKNRIYVKNLNWEINMSLSDKTIQEAFDVPPTHPGPMLLDVFWYRFVKDPPSSWNIANVLYTYGTAGREADTLDVNVVPQTNASSKCHSS